MSIYIVACEIENGVSENDRQELRKAIQLAIKSYKCIEL